WRDSGFGSGKPVFRHYNRRSRHCNHESTLMQFMMFSKHLQSLPLPAAARAVRELGFEGLDLTVRPGGSVEPDQVRDRLPAAIAMCRDAGLAVPLLTTSITVSDPAAAATFDAAAQNDVREIKLGYWQYQQF